MNIIHRPVFKVDEVCARYSENENTKVSYVCTTESDRCAGMIDVFYRETPHPMFGNRYFGLFVGTDKLNYICDADWVESLFFDMIDHNGALYYSRATHDCVSVPLDETRVAVIDGGRGYTRVLNHQLVSVKKLKVLDGKFVEVLDTEDQAV